MRVVVSRVMPFALFLAPWIAPGAEVRIASDFPGGNIVIERIEGDDVFVHQDLRDTKGDWFYWYFAVRGAQGRELTFHFTRSRAIGPLGPGVSRDGGRSWAWLGRRGSPTSFTCGFGSDDTEVRFSFGMPYQHADLMRFLERHAKKPCLKREVLGKTRKGRPVDLLRIGRPGARAKHKVLVTARHHACEMMASYVAEGLIDAFLEDSETGRWLREHVDCAVVPMVDLDGVEDGDQGKNRQPHDHKADYRGTSIYPEVAALRKFLAEWAGGRPDVDIDLHNPGINHDRIYTHALRAAVGEGPESRAPERKFLETLEAVQRGPMKFRLQDSVDFAARMAAKSKTAEGEGATPGDKVPGTMAGSRDGEVNAGFEIPYALVGDVPVTPDSARAFGHDIARALVVSANGILGDLPEAGASALDPSPTGQAEEIAVSHPTATRRERFALPKAGHTARVIIE